MKYVRVTYFTFASRSDDSMVTKVTPYNEFV